jgi:hypothetical protein
LSGGPVGPELFGLAGLDFIGFIDESLILRRVFAA